MPTHESILHDLNFEGGDLLTSAELQAIWAERAERLARLPETEIMGKTIELLIFRLGEEQYGVAINNVKEIHPFESLTPVPHTPDFFAGIFSARGRILSVIDPLSFLGLAPNDAKKDKIIVVSDQDDQDFELGILVTDTEDVRTVYQDEIDTSIITQNSDTNYTQGVTTDLVEVLNLNMLLKDKRLIINQG